MNESDTTTNGVRVEVRSYYVAERSRPYRGEWYFAYRVRISNVGQETVQVMSRHWIITDANGDVEEVRGAGVVGEQPVIAVGESFEYTSACPLGTSFGAMQGSYQVVNGEGDPFDAEIGAFSLTEPFAIN